MKKTTGRNFVHLHNHTEYSLMNGISRERDIVKHAANFEMEHIAITDIGNMTGVLVFIDWCKAYGINPIVGCEVQIMRTSKSKEYKNLVLLAKDFKGYKNLIKLSSYGYIKTEHHKPAVEIEYIRTHAKGIICLSGGMKGEISSLILSGNKEEAKEIAIEYNKLFGKGNFYLQVEDHGIPEEKIINKQIVLLSKKTGIPVVAANDTYYISKEDAEAHYIQGCLANSQKINKNYMEQPGFGEYYIKSSEEMASIFSGTPEALGNTIIIAEKCNLEIDMPGPELPDYKVPVQFLSASDYLHHLALEGLKDRYVTITKEIQERFDFELEIIISSGFANYFLIVHDYTNWANLHDIPLSTGYGQTPGSIIAYSLKITDIDPLKYGLLFECFINPECIENPDIVTEICPAGRKKLIKYISGKYGHTHVSCISQFTCRDTKSVMLDIANILDIPETDINIFSKKFPEDFYLPIQATINNKPGLMDLIQKNIKLRKLFDISKLLDRLSSSMTINERFIAIGRKNLENLVPLYMDDETDLFSVQYNRLYRLEENGFILFALDGLESLSLIRKIINLIRNKKPNFSITGINTDDKITLDIFRNGYTEDIFEFQSPEIREFLKQMSPDSIDDLILLNYLRCSFSWQYIPEFIDRKKGKIEITYLNNGMENILKSTYGIIVYPEQFMEVVHLVSKFSVGRANVLRETITMGKVENKEKCKIEFINAASENGYSKEKASDIFTNLESVQNYTFSKSHAVAHTMVAYRMAFLKAHYPEEFEKTI